MSDYQVKSVTERSNGDLLVVLAPNSAGSASAAIGFILALGLMHAFGAHGIGNFLGFWLVATCISAVWSWQSGVVALLLAIGFFF